MAYNHQPALHDLHENYFDVLKARVTTLHNHTYWQVTMFNPKTSEHTFRFTDEEPTLIHPGRNILNSWDHYYNELLNPGVYVVVEAQNLIQDLPPPSA